MARVLMVQGTMSNAGKSLLAAGLCRLFARRGYRVAPFKSQNMALNSFVTREGLEIGRAQAMQAQACGIEPSADMNPILLKPTSDVGSQVIVSGKPLANMRAREYFQYKKTLIPQIMDAYQRLAARHDIIFVEGAGSPAEINLKAEDIVNMGLARMIDAPVLLVGDIDPGGVFAQLYGTWALLPEEERRRIRGFVINKFRGDRRLLDPGIAMLEKKVGIPVLGVLPYMDLTIDDEDSLSNKLRDGEPDQIDIAVIRLPHMANFSDLTVFEKREGVSLRYIKSPDRLCRADLVILPGSKNTTADLKWIREVGLAAEIQKFAKRGGLLAGICGGYQMLGQRVSDPHGLEGGGDCRGLGILPLKTVLGKDKKLTRVRGYFSDDLTGPWSCLRGRSVEGYEIHMGQTKLTERTAFFDEQTNIEETAGQTDSSQEGRQVSRQGWTYLEQIKTCSSNDVDGADHLQMEGMVLGSVLGTYVHGIFDKTGNAEVLLNTIAGRKGLSRRYKVRETADFARKQYDILADCLEQYMDIRQIEEILNL